MKKLAISAPSDEETYDYSTSVRCFGCSPLGEAVQVDHPAVSYPHDANLTVRSKPPLMVS